MGKIKNHQPEASNVSRETILNETELGLLEMVKGFDNLMQHCGALAFAKLNNVYCHLDDHILNDGQDRLKIVTNDGRDQRLFIEADMMSLNVDGFAYV